jgi:hypothetical protein
MDCIRLHAEGTPLMPSLLTPVSSLAHPLCFPRYVDMVITEVGMTPPTSVPVLIREQSKELAA